MGERIAARHSIGRRRFRVRRRAPAALRPLRATLRSTVGGQSLPRRRSAEHRRSLEAARSGTSSTTAGGRRARVVLRWRKSPSPSSATSATAAASSPMDDFRTYRPQDRCARRKPTAASFTLHTPPPPSGGITSLAIVQTVEQFDRQGMQPWDGTYFHVLAEATKACWQERHNMLGDPDCIDIRLRPACFRRSGRSTSTTNPRRTIFFVADRRPINRRTRRM